MIYNVECRIKNVELKIIKTGRFFVLQFCKQNVAKQKRTCENNQQNAMKLIQN